MGKIFETFSLCLNHLLFFLIISYDFVNYLRNRFRFFCIQHSSRAPIVSGMAVDL